MAELDDDKQLEEHKQNKVSTYDYLPQVFFSFIIYTFCLAFSLNKWSMKVIYAYSFSCSWLHICY
jgi:hypothetical protein